MEQFWSNYQREYEDAFRLECSKEDIKTNKDAKKLYKQLKKQRRYVKKVERLINKIINPLPIYRSDLVYYLSKYLIENNWI